MMLFKDLLLFALLGIRIIEARKTFQLFVIPSFTVVLADDTVVGSSIQVETDAEHLYKIGQKVSEAVEAHLFAAFEAESALDSIEVGVTVQNKDQGETELRFDINGNIYFIQDKYQASHDLTQQIVRGIIETAFEGTYGNVAFVNLLLPLLPDNPVVRVSFENDEDHGLGQGDNDAIVDPNSKTELKTPTVNSGENVPLVANGGDDSNVIVASMATAMTVLALALFVYVRKDKKINKSEHLLLNVDQYSDYSDDEIEGELQLDDGSYEAFDAEQGIQFIPVPAKIDESKVNKKTKAAMKDVTPKRYVQPDSPFELLYGASFSHRDAAIVAKAHRTKVSRNRSVKVSGKKIKKRAPLKPMQPITEDHEDADRVPSEEKKEDLFVYRDFPRHDGTPCVMFTTVDNVEWNAVEKNEELSQSPNKDMYVASPNSENSPKHEEKIDSFVDKLENLMLARSRQYEERKDFDKELTERKIARLAERNKAKEEETQSLLLEGVADSSSKEDQSTKIEEDERYHDKGNENNDVTEVSENRNKLESCKTNILLSIDDNSQEFENNKSDEADVLLNTEVESKDNDKQTVESKSVIDSTSCETGILLSIDDNIQGAGNNTEELLKLSMPDENETFASVMEDMSLSSEDTEIDSSTKLPSSPESKLSAVAARESDSPENQPTIDVPDAIDTLQRAEVDAPVVDISTNADGQIEAKDISIANKGIPVLDDKPTTELDKNGSSGSQDSILSVELQTASTQKTEEVPDDLSCSGSQDSDSVLSVELQTTSTQKAEEVSDELSSSGSCSGSQDSILSVELQTTSTQKAEEVPDELSCSGSQDTVLSVELQTTSIQKTEEVSDELSCSGSQDSFSALSVELQTTSSQKAVEVSDGLSNSGSQDSVLSVELQTSSSQKAEEASDGLSSSGSQDSDSVLSVELQTISS